MVVVGFYYFFGAEKMHMFMMQTFCAKCFQIQLKTIKKIDCHDRNRRL